MAGALGIGGGIVVVPALLFLFNQMQAVPLASTMHMAAASSLAVMVVTSLSAIYAHSRKAPLAWHVYYKLAPGVILGAIAGALLSMHVPKAGLEILLGIFLLFVAVKMLGEGEVEPKRSFPAAWVHAFVSFVIGIKSGLLGIGGGALIVPYLTYCGVNMRQIPAISALCTLSVGFFGSLQWYLLSRSIEGLPAYSSGFIYWPAVVCVAIFSVLSAALGAKLTYLLPTRILRYLFVVVVVIVAIHLLY
jgi:uncharacterized membrane protein YfcA